MKRALLLAIAALLGTACIGSNHAAGSGSDQNSQAVRIIVGFSDPGRTYNHPAILKTLSHELAAEVTFLRQLSGNAALYLCQTPDPIDRFLARFKNLSAHSDIEYVELDQKRAKRN